MDVNTSYKDLHTLSLFLHVYPFASTPDLPFSNLPVIFLPMWWTRLQRPFIIAIESMYILTSDHFFLHKLDGQVHHPKLCSLKGFLSPLSFKAKPKWGCNAPITHPYTKLFILKPSSGFLLFQLVFSPTGVSRDRSTVTIMSDMEVCTLSSCTRLRPYSRLVRDVPFHPM